MMERQRQPVWFVPRVEAPPRNKLKDTPFLEKSNEHMVIDPSPNNPVMVEGERISKTYDVVGSVSRTKCGLAVIRFSENTGFIMLISNEGMIWRTADETLVKWFRKDVERAAGDNPEVLVYTLSHPKLGVEVTI